MQKIIIYGNGNIAKILSHYISQSFEIVGYTVDEAYILDSQFEGKPLIAFENILEHYNIQEVKMLTAIGFVQLNKVRQSAYERAKEKGFSFANYIDKAARIVGNSSIGENNIILDNTSVQPGTSIGNGNIIWSNSTIAHGTTVKDFNWLTSGTTIAGNVEIGDRNFLGINASIGHDRRIADDCFISANTYVNCDLKNKQVMLSDAGDLINMPSDKFMKFSKINSA